MAAPAQAYSSRHTESIADLIRRGGALEADTTERRGAIAGQMWQGIGQNVGGFLSQLADENWHGPERKRQQEAQATRDRLSTEAAQMELADRKAKTAATEKETGIQQQIAVYRAKAMKQNADGTWALDLSNLRGQMEQAGLGDRMDAIERDYNDLQKDTLTLSNLRAQRKQLEDVAFGRLGRMIQAGGNTPEAFAAAVAHVQANEMLTDAQLKPYIDAVDKDPASIERVGNVLASLGGQVKTEKGPEAGSFGDVLRRKETELGRPLSAQEALTLRRSFEATGWKPERPRESGGAGSTLSATQLSVAKRWKADALKDAEGGKDKELAEAVGTFQKMLLEARDPKNAADPKVQAARAFMDQAKRDIYGRLEQRKQNVLRDYDDMIGYVRPEPGDTPAPSPAPGPAAGAGFRAGYQSPSVENMKPAPSKYAGRVIDRATVQQLAQRYGISYEEAKSRAEQTYGVVVR